MYSNCIINSNKELDSETDSLEFKLGKQIFEDNGTDTNMNNSNRQEILNKCTSKLNNSNSKIKLILWGISDSGKVVGLDKNAYNDHITNSSERVSSGCRISSDYISELENQLSRKSSIDETYVFYIENNSKPILGTILLQHQTNKSDKSQTEITHFT